MVGRSYSLRQTIISSRAQRISHVKAKILRQMARQTKPASIVAVTYWVLFQQDFHVEVEYATDHLRGVIEQWRDVSTLALRTALRHSDLQATAKTADAPWWRCVGVAADLPSTHLCETGTTGSRAKNEARFDSRFTIGHCCKLIY